MTHRYIKVGVTTVVLLTAFSALLWTTLAEGTEYYKHVDEVMASPEQWHSKKLQLHGFVVPGSHFMNPKTLEHRFQVQFNGKVVNASYQGVVPDTFKDEAEVVLRGRLSPEGFHTDKGGVMAKCPSKYEEKSTFEEQKKVG